MWRAWGSGIYDIFEDFVSGRLTVFQGFFGLDPFVKDMLRGHESIIKVVVLVHLWLGVGGDHQIAQCTINRVHSGAYKMNRRESFSGGRT